MEKICFVVHCVRIRDAYTRGNYVAIHQCIRKGTGMIIIPVVSSGLSRKSAKGEVKTILPNSLSNSARSWIHSVFFFLGATSHEWKHYNVRWY